MSSQSDSCLDLEHDAIARLAIQIWMAEGCQPDRDLEYWLRAESVKNNLEQEVRYASEAHIRTVNQTSLAA
jgi:hypothetical protein